MKRAVIVVSLVEEADKTVNRDVEEEIMKELSKNASVIPWAKAVLSVKVE